MGMEKKKNGFRAQRIFAKNRRGVIDKRSGGEKLLYAMVFIVFSLQAFTLLFVIWWLFNNSLKDPFEYGRMQNSMALPDKPLFGNYLQAFRLLNAGEISFVEMLGNSLLYTIVCSFLGSFTPAVTGYVLSKYRFKGREIIYSLAIICMTLPIVGTGAAYMKLLHTLGLYNNPLFYVANALGGFNGTFLIYAAFFGGLSWSYAEAAEIDGANPWQIFFHVMFPQSLPIYFTYVIICAIACWNEYNMMILYMPDWLSLAAGLYSFRANAERGANYPVFFAGLIISMIPTFVLFAVFSDKVMTSLSVGGLKG